MDFHRSPEPRPAAIAYEEWPFDEMLSEYLPCPQKPPRASLTQLLETRRSRRRGTSVDKEHLSTILWFAAKTMVATVGGFPRWEHRGTPSAGGCHPIDILVSNWMPNPGILYRYEPIGHALMRLRVADQDAADELNRAGAEAVGNDAGTLLWHAAQFERTGSRYIDGESLVWRDAGALVVTISLLAELLDLSCCAIGATGEPHLSRALGSGERVVGVGGCVIGRRGV